MALSGLEDFKRIKCLFVVSARCHLLVAKTASTLCANQFLKLSNAMLAKLKGNISFESFMDLNNAPLSESSNLFSEEAFKKAIEKSSRVLHHETIRKAVSQEKPAKKFTILLQFSQFFRQSQQPLEVFWSPAF